MIGRTGERWSGISMLAAGHDDDDWESNEPYICLVNKLNCATCSGRVKEVVEESENRNKKRENKK